MHLDSKYQTAFSRPLLVLDDDRPWTTIDYDCRHCGNMNTCGVATYQRHLRRRLHQPSVRPVVLCIFPRRLFDTLLLFSLMNLRQPPLKHI